MQFITGCLITRASHTLPVGHLFAPLSLVCVCVCMCALPQVMRGEYGKEVGNAAEQLTVHMDKFVSGCFRGFEDSYNKLEKAIRGSMDWRNRAGAAQGGGASNRQRRRRTTLQLMARNCSSSSSEDNSQDDAQHMEADGEEEVAGRELQNGLLAHAAA